LAIFSTAAKLMQLLRIEWADDSVFGGQLGEVLIGNGRVCMASHQS
jgi:hypothetical protein